MPDLPFDHYCGATCRGELWFSVCGVPMVDHAPGTVDDSGRQPWDIAAVKPLKSIVVYQAVEGDTRRITATISGPGSGADHQLDDGDPNPRVASDVHGNATVVWTRDGTLRSAFRTGAGGWSAPATVLAPASGARITGDTLAMTAAPDGRSRTLLLVTLATAPAYGAGGEIIAVSADDAGWGGRVGAMSPQVTAVDPTTVTGNGSATTITTHFRVDRPGRVVISVRTSRLSLARIVSVRTGWNTVRLPRFAVTAGYCVSVGPNADPTGPGTQTTAVVRRIVAAR